MQYNVFLLKFLTPVHFGDTAGGGGLDKISLTCSADTFFSALCTEAAVAKPALLKELLKETSAGRLVFSSLFPYYLQANEDVELYLPRPLYTPARAPKKLSSFAETKELATKLKKLKKASYVRASKIGQLIDPKEESATLELPEFAAPLTAGRVNLRLDEPLPYYVSSYVFAPRSGLYFVCGTEENNLADLLEELLTDLGCSGIGGKRSSGYGKFELADNKWEISDGGGFYDDDNALAAMLTDTAAPIQMCIAPFCPSPDETGAIKEGSYKLTKRGAFTACAGENIKGNSIYMLTEGSCFKKRFSGTLQEQHIEGIEHPIYRYAKGMFVGLKNG